MRHYILFAVCFVLVIFWQALGQEPECLFSDIPGNEVLIESVPILQDTSLRVAILFVQFADWQNNVDARGSVGWSHFDPNDPQTYIIYNKFRYPHFWDMYFTRNTYYDSTDVIPPITHHPDYDSHGITVSGSFRDFWHEVSHGEFDTKPAVTHPAETDTMFRSGIINRFRADSSMVWVTLDQDKDFFIYPGAPPHNYVQLIDSAVAEAHRLYADSLNTPDSLRLHVDVKDASKIDRVLVCYSGALGYGVAPFVGARYATYSERDIRTAGETSYLYGIGTAAHEFGDLIGFGDFHGGPSRFSDGLGLFSIMAVGQYQNNGCSPNHLDAWNKLRIGWLDYDLMENDTSSYSPFAVEDTSSAGLPKVAVLKAFGELGPEDGQWKGSDKNYFVLENRSTIGFDLTLNFGDPLFPGGMIIWQYSGTGRFPNHYHIRLVEADADSSNPEGDLAIPGGDRGSKADFFPGEENLTFIIG